MAAVANLPPPVAAPNANLLQQADGNRDQTIRNLSAAIERNSQEYKRVREELDTKNRELQEEKERTAQLEGRLFAYQRAQAVQIHATQKQKVIHRSGWRDACEKVARVWKSNSKLITGAVYIAGGAVLSYVFGEHKVAATLVTFGVVSIIGWSAS